MTAGTIAGLLDEAAANRPDRPILREPSGATLTVAEVADLSHGVCHWLWAAGVRPGMTVAWQLPSHVAAALVMMGLTRASVTQAPVIHVYRSREVCAALEVADADVLIVDASTACNVPPGFHTIELPADFVDQMRTLPTVAHPELTGAPTADAPCWVFFTSGTTGRPKGVRHSDATLLAAAHGWSQHLGLGTHPNDVGSIVFPIAHIGGIVYLAGALIADFPVLVASKVAAERLPTLLADHRVTVAGASTATYQMLLSAQLASGRREPLIPSLRMLTGGGAACPVELHRTVRETMGVPIVHAYGMTEAPMVCVSPASDTEEQQSNSSGLPIPGSAIRFSPAGEIEVRGNSMTPGYVDAAQWRAATTADGWLRTGDLGHARADGRIVVTGRLKDLIIRKGENIAPDEVENELLAHPLVDEVAVLGQPDELRGELVCAVVRRSAHHRDVTLDDLCAFLDRRGLMKQKWPERLVLVDEFPMTGLGKVAKLVLAQQISGDCR